MRGFCLQMGGGLPQPPRPLPACLAAQACFGNFVVLRTHHARIVFANGGAGGRAPANPPLFLLNPAPAISATIDPDPF